jgi:thiamine-monophosphate kinase
MKLSELGQFKMIDIIAGMIAKTRDTQIESWRNVVAGVGDDCAVWKSSAGYQFGKVDCQVQGVHFNLDLISWEDLGWKALAVNLSDIAAMGGVPAYALVSLGLPLDTEVENVEALYRGLLDLASLSGTAIVGGNLSSAPLIFVDVSLIGQAGNPQGRFLSRSAARAGDLIAVTGCLGDAAAGLDMLQKKVSFSTAEVPLRRAFRRPEPRLEEGRLLVEKGVRAGMDISDGLLADLGHICAASQVSAEIYLDRLPIRPELKNRFGAQAVELALSGGEDYQLLFTAKADNIKEAQTSSRYPITVIGEIGPWKEKAVQVIDRQGDVYLPLKTGWDHFKRRETHEEPENYHSRA